MLHIDLSTPDKMQSAEAAIEAAAAKRLAGPHVVAQTVHYQVLDHGEDWKGRWSHRFALQRKDEYRKSRAMPRWAFSDYSADTLMDAMHAAEKFHLENMQHCGGF